MARKLAIVLSVILTGVGMSHCFRKDASVVQPLDRTIEAPAFREPVARRLIPVPPGGASTSQELPPAITSPFRIPLAQTQAAPPDSMASVQPEFRQEVKPSSNMFRPQDLDEDADAGLSRRPSGDAVAEQGTYLTHKIADGDTLSGIAVKYLGSAQRYVEIFNLNRDVLRSPDLLPIGRVLKIRQQAPGELVLGPATIGAHSDGEPAISQGE